MDGRMDVAEGRKKKKGGDEGRRGGGREGYHEDGMPFEEAVIASWKTTENGERGGP
jgi:hypothetical protein